MKPLYVRIFHWGIVLLFSLALVTGYTAFDFDLSMRIKTRDALFVIHRLSGVTAGICLLVWGSMRLFRWWRNRKTSSLSLVSMMHVGFGVICLALPLAPWIARSLDGRWHELYMLIPKANLVSHPTTHLAYKLLDTHKDIVNLFLVLLGIHLAGVAYHLFVRKDGSLRSMLFRPFHGSLEP